MPAPAPTKKIIYIFIVSASKILYNITGIYVKLCSHQQDKGCFSKVFCGKSYFKLTFQSQLEFAGQVQMLKLKKHIAITQRYAATTSELSK